jgi:hypothetical protein
MNPAIGAMYGIVIKAAVMMVVAFLCILGARLGGNHLVRSNPQWSKQKKEGAHALSTFAAVVVFAVFVIGFVLR